MVANKIIYEPYIFCIIIAQVFETSPKNIVRSHVLWNGIQQFYFTIYKSIFSMDLKANINEDIKAHFILNIIFCFIWIWNVKCGHMYEPREVFRISKSFGLSSEQKPRNEKCSQRCNIFSSLRILTCKNTPEIY